MSVMSKEFDAANSVVHRVEDQWHYTILVLCGFVAETKQAVGFVRCYKYSHCDGRTVKCCTGVNADHWESNDGHGGYWSSLEKWAKK